MPDSKMEIMNARALRDQFLQLQEQAARDSLTGLLNRRTLEQYINQRLLRMKPLDSCALFIVDLDNFKSVNDTLGHQAGDQVLCHATRILSGLFRASDIVGRLGGDEFVVFIFGNITEELVRRKGQMICDQIQLTVGKEHEITVTVSVGIHLARGGNLTFEALYRSADLALYKAKKNGRRCFCIKLNTEENAPDKDVYKLVNTVKMSNILEHIESGVALLELSEPFHLIYAGRGLGKMLSLNGEKGKMPSLLERVCESDRKKAIEMFRELGEMAPGSANHCVCRICRKGEACAWWRIHAVRIEYNSIHPVLLLTVTDVSEFKEKENRLIENNSRLQSVLDQTLHCIWEVDLADRKLYIYGEEKQFLLSGAQQGEFPENLIESGWIAPDSAMRFREFADEMLQGASNGYGNFILRYGKTGTYGWATLSYRMVYNELGKPARAVGIIDTLTQNDESYMEKRRRLPEEVITRLVLDVKANLSKDIVYKLWREGRRIMGEAGHALICSEILKEESERIYSGQEKSRIPFTREALLEAYERGERWLYWEYRRTDENGQIGWVLGVASLYREGDCDDVYMLACLNRLDKKKHWEAQLGLELRKDAVTKLYTRDTGKKMAQALLKKSGSAFCALAMIRIGGLSGFSKQGMEYMARCRFSICSALMFALGADSLLSQYETDRILVFFPEASAEEEVRRRLETAFSFVREILEDCIPIHDIQFLAGAIVEYTEQIDYDASVGHVDYVCSYWKNAAEDIVIFDKNIGGTEIDQLHKEEQSQVKIHQEELGRPLSDWEKTAALDCFSIMLRADSLEHSIQGVLGCLGNYYDADRVYILRLAQEQWVVTMPYEWNANHKYSIKQIVSGMGLSHFPILRRCIQERAPVFLSRETHPGMPVSADVGEHWGFFIVPIGQQDEYFLCVENASEHMQDAALIGKLAPYLLKEKERYQSKNRVSAWEHEKLGTELPNLRSYMEMTKVVNSELYSSMGAVCVNIPELSVLSNSKGLEYSSRLLWFVSRTMEDVFGKEFLFRTWDTEFVALCPNVTRTVFEGKTIRLQGMLRRRYPGKLQVGCSWAEGVFNGKALVEEAHTVMKIEDQPQISLPPRIRPFGNIGEAVRNGRFTVLFQPEVNLITGRLLGAEALVRGLNGDGGMIPPNQFLAEMEQDGSVRDLDFFVLDHVMRHLKQWGDQGLRLSPVSVNISQATLLSDSAPASLLAIQSRYPDVDPQLLRLEIRGGGGLEIVRQRMEMIRSFGIGFCLDNFSGSNLEKTMLEELDFDAVKIDRTLIQGMVGDDKRLRQVREIVGVCSDRKCQCIAGGVETMEQIAKLIQAGCNYAQGYFYDRPLPSEVFKRKYLFTKGGRRNGRTKEV